VREPLIVRGLQSRQGFVGYAVDVAAGNVDRGPGAGILVPLHHGWPHELASSIAHLAGPCPDEHVDLAGMVRVVRAEPSREYLLGVGGHPRDVESSNVELLACTVHAQVNDRRLGGGQIMVLLHGYALLS